MKNTFLVSLLIALSSAVFAQDINTQEINTDEYQVACGGCCPRPNAILKEGWYKVKAPSNYFVQYVKPITGCNGVLTGLKVWYKDNTGTPSEYTCEGNTCTSGSGASCRTISIQSETSYIFTDSDRQPGTFIFM